jgi:hypothetical protein
VQFPLKTGEIVSQIKWIFDPLFVNVSAFCFETPPQGPILSFEVLVPSLLIGNITWASFFIQNYWI